MRFLDTFTEDAPALPVCTPMEFWRCAYKNEALVQCSENFSCLDSYWHCMIACEGSVIKAHDSDQLRYVLEVSTHGILASGGAVQEFDLLRMLGTDGANWTQLSIRDDWQDRRAIAVRGGASSIRAARVSTHARTSWFCFALCVL